MTNDIEHMYLPSFERPFFFRLAILNNYLNSSSKKESRYAVNIFNGVRLLGKKNDDMFIFDVDKHIPNNSATNIIDIYYLKEAEFNVRNDFSMVVGEKYVPYSLKDCFFNDDIFFNNVTSADYKTYREGIIDDIFASKNSMAVLGIGDTLPPQTQHGDKCTIQFKVEEAVPYNYNGLLKAEEINDELDIRMYDSFTLDTNENTITFSKDAVSTSNVNYYRVLKTDIENLSTEMDKLVCCEPTLKNVKISNKYDYPFNNKWINITDKLTNEEYFEVQEGYCIIGVGNKYLEEDDNSRYYDNQITVINVYNSSVSNGQIRFYLNGY